MRWLAGLLIWATPVAAVTCSDIDHLGASYTVCDVDPTTDALRLFLRDDAGNVLGSFSAVESHADSPLLFAMNAGMYHEDRRPVGLYIENGVQEMRAVASAGPGNFGLLPNAVFCITDERAQVIETNTYINTGAACRDATQSGPMVVIDGNLHPALIPNGTSRNIRNGVGTSINGDRAVFVISNEPVNFHDFATLFRDTLGLPNALYFDGKVSRLHAPMLSRSDFGRQMGPVVGVLAD